MFFLEIYLYECDVAVWTERENSRFEYAEWMEAARHTRQSAGTSEDPANARGLVLVAQPDTAQSEVRRGARDVPLRWVSFACVECARGPCARA